MKEWDVHVTHDNDVYVTSEDFTHDVYLKVTGDFWCISQKLEYAQKIADILNANGTFVLESDADKRYEIENHRKFPHLYEGRSVRKD